MYYDFLIEIMFYALSAVFLGRLCECILCVCLLTSICSYLANKPMKPLKHLSIIDSVVEIVFCSKIRDETIMIEYISRYEI